MLYGNKHDYPVNYRIFVSHRVEGGDDDVANADDNNNNNNNNNSESGGGGHPTPTIAATGRPASGIGAGGKDFGALVQSSAHPIIAATAAPLLPPKPPHQMTPKRGMRKWTLVIEGGLLVKQLDYDSAKLVDERLNAGLPILGCTNGEETDDNNHEEDKDRVIRPPPLSKDHWRGGTAERENEKEMEKLKFTHLFDKMEVEMRVYKQGESATSTAVAAAAAGDETSAITRSGLGSVPDPPHMTATPSIADNNNLPRIERYTWERNGRSTNTPDSDAFFIVHNEQSEFIPMGGKVFKSTFKVDHIATRIKLYRRQPLSNTNDDDANYIPSPQLCYVFFPTFIGKSVAADRKGGRGSSKSDKPKKRIRSTGGDTIALSSAASTASLDNSNNDSFDEGGGKTTSSFADYHPSSTTDQYIPNTLTMEEVLHAIFFYIRSRNLQDVIDLSVVINNDELSSLFGCTRMLFSDVRNILLQKQLLVKVESCTHPIILNYEMTLNGAEPLTKTRPTITNTTMLSSTQKVDNEAAESTKRRRVATNTTTNDEDIASQQQTGESVQQPYQTMLSVDADIDIPNLFPIRTRNVLRLTKDREYDYNSSRTKAQRSLTSMKIDEVTAKHVMGDVVTGKGLAKNHKQALMAIAAASNPRGEAQRAALIDLRTAALMEKLEEQCSMASGYWQVVDACKGICSSTPN